VVTFSQFYYQYTGTLIMTEPEQSQRGTNNQVTEEYRVLHKVAQVLQAQGELEPMLKEAMWALTRFEELKVENKAGIFLVEESKKVLKLFTTVGGFSQEFLEKEKEVPFGDCLCGRVAVSGELMMSESCYADSRHERTFSDMTAHGHYIVPLKTSDQLIGVMFLYTNTNPVWYKHSQEVLLSIGGLIADAIQKKKIDRELQEYRNHLENLVDIRTSELRQLSHQIQKIREEEKSRMSREVHDELGQSLTALKMDLFQLEKQFPEDSQDWRKRTQSMMNMVDNTIKSVQRIAMELRPPILDAFGLCEAIAWQAGEYERRYSLKFDLNCLESHLELDEDLKTTFFRIFQESITNVVRHAKASKVSVNMNHQDNQLVMKIRDNGKGIQKDQAEGSSSLGLIGIRERVRYWNGEVFFHGAPEQGTTVEIRIPVAK
jgi:signal transduction histidine kinase